MKTTIEPGQKLTDGDYFEGGTIEQYKELFEIEGYDGWLTESLNASIGYGFTVLKSGVLVWHFDERKTRYSFEAFKQLCENTFKQG